MTFEEFEQKILELNQMHETNKNHEGKVCVCGHVDEITPENVETFLNNASAYFNVPITYAMRYLISRYTINSSIKPIFSNLQDEEIKFVFAKPAQLHNLVVLLEAKAVNLFFDTLLKEGQLTLEEFFEHLTPENQTKYLEKYTIESGCLNTFIMHAPNVEQIKLNPEKKYQIYIDENNVDNQAFIEGIYTLLSTNSKNLKEYPKIIITDGRLAEKLAEQGHYAIAVLADTNNIIYNLLLNGLPKPIKHKLDEAFITAIERKFNKELIKIKGGQ